MPQTLLLWEEACARQWNVGERWSGFFIVGVIGNATFAIPRAISSYPTLEHI